MYRISLSDPVYPVILSKNSKLNMLLLAAIFRLLALTGFLFSLMVHVGALLGHDIPFEDGTWMLHVGIFVVWVPAVLAGRQLSRDFRQKDFWKAVLRGCPAWLRRLAQALFAYAILNFLLFTLSMFGGGGAEPASPAHHFLRLASGHWMAFYLMSYAILTSAVRVREMDRARRCSNGHPVPAADRFCGQCGEEVM
jgi:hypothetical protein